MGWVKLSVAEAPSMPTQSEAEYSPTELPAVGPETGMEMVGIMREPVTDWIMSWFWYGWSGVAAGGW